MEEDGFKALPYRKELTVKGGVEQAEAAVLKALGAKGFRPMVTKDGGTTLIASQKGAYSRLGYILTHISIILIFVGALIGSFFGFKGFLNLPEGEASAVVYLRNEPLWDRIMDSLGIAKSAVVYDQRGGVPYMPLGFFLRCDDFEVDYYTNAGRPTGMPSEYWSILSVYDRSQQKVLDKRIVVNDPLTYRGITFYQSSYGTMPEARGAVVLTVKPKNSPGPGETVVVQPGGEEYVASIDRTIKVLGVAPFAMRDPMSGQVQYYRSDNNEFINPAIEIEVYRGKSGKSPVFRTQLLKVDSLEPRMPEDYIISYFDYWGARYTGLQVNKDPGVWVVYAGFTLLCFGPLIAFFGSHKKVWARIADRKGQAAVLIGGSVNRNRLGFERQLNAVVEEISR
jgi:cytochrome c biogenesis protein